jgi:hypothetical protein
MEEREQYIMSMLKEIKSGKYIVLDNSGKIVIMSRDKRVCEYYLTKLQTEKE